jgi:YfiR/HmsC-like
MCSGECLPERGRPPQWTARVARPVGCRWLVLVVLTLAVCWTWGAGRARAEDLLVPARVQAALIGKVVSFDRNFAARVQNKVTIAVVSKSSSSDSERAAAQMLGAFRELGPTAGLPHEELRVAWTDAHALAAACAERKVAIVYLTPGFDNEAASIAKALDAARVLTVAGSLSYVKNGLVLGFDLVSGRPKLVVHLASARRQGIAFDATFLAITRVVQ